MEIVLDTNFLMYCAKQRIDLIAELGRVLDIKFRMIVPSLVLGELQKLAIAKRTKRADREAALLALQIVERLRERGNILVQHTEAENADGAILLYDKSDTAVATLDKALRQRLKNAKIVLVRQRKYLQLI